jgi:hypothetical protein
MEFVCMHACVGECVLVCVCICVCKDSLIPRFRYTFEYLPGTDEYSHADLNAMKFVIGQR